MFQNNEINVTESSPEISSLLQFQIKPVSTTLALLGESRIKNLTSLKKNCTIWQKEKVKLFLN